ncbi:MAG: 50S ribosomal protein L3 [Myxococcales bacterium]|nr:50S ribosomal protein L3 [Myxococcales bacterium]|tara:strand:+ start:952 stop:1680 length:729 start_codon:yes stop_codon:yes gene_type:complete
MSLAVLATKEGMTQMFLEDGVRVPVTVMRVEPNVVVQKKTVEKDGYNALQLGYGDIREKLVTKPEAGHMKKAGVDMKRYLREVRVTEEELAQYEVGQSITAEILAESESLDIAGVSKGRGFAGVMKRHNMKGFRATHGTHEYFRHGGSIGCRAKPGKVFKGKKMPGHMGNARVTVKNLRVIEVDGEEGVVIVRGSIPGPKGGLVELHQSSRKVRPLHGIGGAVITERSKNPMKASKAAGSRR